MLWALHIHMSPCTCCCCTLKLPTLLLHSGAHLTATAYKIPLSIGAINAFTVGLRTLLLLLLRPKVPYTAGAEL